ncbi:MAG: toll/interleukin-1 receptor domain-containing protein [Desulfobacteraceae bacterium]|nr:toll/interleukin-1 receptor domain-containing protein [Desulfobacteraceae bacterium]
MLPNDSKFKNACFISYKHPPANAPLNHKFYVFANAIQRRINACLTVNITAYRDVDLKSYPGIKYPAALSEELCKSVCLVAILVPQYWESFWCRAEWKAMENLESKRLGKSKKEGLIIPVIYRGETEEWRKLIGVREPSVLKVVKPATQLDNVSNLEKIEKIASRIDRLVNMLRDPRVNCNEFRIPIVGKEDKIVTAFIDPNPVEW